VAPERSVSGFFSAVGASLLPTRNCSPILLQRAKEKFPEARPRIISDNGPQFIAKDFKEFIRISGMTHVRTSPYYPQSNGKMERWNKSIKSESIRPGVPLSVEDAERLITQYVQVYNEQRLHSAIGLSRRRPCGKDARRKSMPRGIKSWGWLESAVRRQQRLSRLNRNLAQAVRRHSR